MIYRNTFSIHVPVIYLVLVLLVLGANSCKKDEKLNHEFYGEGVYSGDYWPTGTWRECSPEEVGVDTAKLLKVYDYCANPDLNTEGLIIIKDGYIIGEAYFGDFRLDSHHASYSVAKSFISATLGIAIDEGFINSEDEYAYIYLPCWQEEGTVPAKKEIKIKHLLTMTGGLEWNEDDYSSNDNDIYLMYDNADDFVDYIANKTLINTPGTVWYYSSGESMLLSGIIENAVGESAFNYAYQKLLQPVGINNITWESDPSGHTIGGWGIMTTVRNYARFGYLYLNEGSWDGEQIISPEWVDISTKKSLDVAEHYGYQWWLAAGLSNYNYPVTPKTYMAVGIYTQRIIIVPEEDLVIVRVGNDYSPDSSDWSTADFLKLVMNAVI